MYRQKSFSNDQPSLYLVATPIGNLEDMTFRAIKILNEVSFIYAEDKRVSGKLLHHFEIKTQLYSYHEFNKEAASAEIIEKLLAGNDIALISDAGYPVVSDPGYLVVKEALKHNINIISLPGGNALLSALVTSGIAPHPFSFHGFLDHKELKKKKELESLLENKETLIFYESPHRINKTLNLMYEVFGERTIALSREITKRYEEIIRGNIKDIKDITDIKGEMVIVVEGKKVSTVISSLSIIEEVEALIANGISSKDAIKQVAKNRRLQKNTVYMEYHSKN
ncbi:MAG: 16S rRNA (cytidine(1402)-2'-O)-methyltransferase [Candidatus Izemoplasma sp.]